jgi:hypothetical protein
MESKGTHFQSFNLNSPNSVKTVASTFPFNLKSSPQNFIQTVYNYSLTTFLPSISYVFKPVAQFRINESGFEAKDIHVTPRVACHI